MATDEELRRHISQLISEYGINQKVLAGKMNVSPSWLSRWLRRQPGVRGITVDAVNGFEEYVADLGNKLKKSTGVRKEGRPGQRARAGRPGDHARKRVAGE